MAVRRLARAGAGMARRRTAALLTDASAAPTPTPATRTWTETPALWTRALSGAAPQERKDEASASSTSASSTDPAAAAAAAVAAQAAAAAKAASEAAAAAAAGFKARLGGGGGGGASSSSSGAGGGGASTTSSPGLWAAIKREVAAAVLPESSVRSVTRAADPAPPGAAPPPGATTAELMAVPQPEPSAWQKQWDRMHAALGSHPAWAKLSKAIDSTGVASKAKDIADDLRDRWETADGPLAHRVAGAADALFAESEMAQALREVRLRDPGFDMVDFLAAVKADVPGLLRAYLSGDGTAMAAHASADLVERVLAVHAAQAAAGAVPDATILDVGDVELVDLKFLDGDPAAVLQFAAQQIACARDAAGSVVEGSPDAVQRVYYLWALVQDAAGSVGPGGEVIPPRWQLREMMVRGAHQLL